MTSYGNSSKQELQSGQENPDGRTHRHLTVIVATNINIEEKRTFEYQRKNIDKARLKAETIATKCL